MRIMNKLYHIF